MTVFIVTVKIALVAVGDVLHALVALLLSLSCPEGIYRGKKDLNRPPPDPKIYKEGRGAYI